MASECRYPRRPGTAEASRCISVGPHQPRKRSARTEWARRPEHSADRMGIGSDMDLEAEARTEMREVYNIYKPVVNPIIN